jgi:hypothetical protein
MLSALTREQDSREDEEDMASQSKDKNHSTTQNHAANPPQTRKQEPPAAINLSNRVLSHSMLIMSNQEESAHLPQTKQEPPGATKPHAATNLPNRVLSHIMPNWMKKYVTPKKHPLEQSQESQDSQDSQAFVQTNDDKFLDDSDDLMSEFPDGNGHISMSKDDMIDPTQSPTIGWCTCTTNTRKDKSSGLRTMYKHCLGCYSCPNCVFRERPRLPQKGKRAGCPPLPSVYEQCPQCCDGTKMHHEECNVSIQWKETGTGWNGTFLALTIIHVLLTWEKFLTLLQKSLPKLLGLHQRPVQSN